jgi:PhnB protein
MRSAAARFRRFIRCGTSGTRASGRCRKGILPEAARDLLPAIRKSVDLDLVEEERSVMLVQPYLFFDGRCEEAVDFYRKALGAEVTALMRYKDCPDTPPPGMVAPGSENKVMHASLRIGDTTVMASDGRCQGQPSFQGFSLSVTVPNEAEADRVFGALADRGTVSMPLTRTFFSPRFGMVSDRFGVGWMVIVAH